MKESKVISFKDIKDMKKQNKRLLINEDIKYVIILAYISIIFLSSFLFNTPREIIIGMKSILLSTSVLVTDYMEYGNIGAAFLNSSLLMMIVVFISRINKKDMNGSLIAAIFTVGGFGLFGKNLYNIWSIFLGVYIYSSIKNRDFSEYILIAFYGTALGPVISLITFGLGFNILDGLILGNLAGIIAGVILPPLANHFVNFHKGFNLYNVGFTAGIIGTLFMSVLRGLGFNSETVSIVLEGKNLVLGTYFFILFASMVVLGWFLNGNKFKGFKKILEEPGTNSPDFINRYGIGPSLINMGILGIISISYVLLVKGDLSGLVIGGVFTVVGFGAFGKHIKNILPVILGVYLASLFKIWEINSAGILLAALFGTTLAPISGTFGWGAGILVGILHVSIVSNTAYIHGGINLYNNGFAGGIVAAIIVPIIQDLKDQ